jgi:hypothetical protein
MPQSPTAASPAKRNGAILPEQEGFPFSVLHPALFALLPVITSLAENLDSIAPISALRAAIMNLALCGGIAYLLGRWLRHRGRRALLVSIYVLLFFSFGHVFGGSVDVFPSLDPVVALPALFPMAIWALLLAASTIAVLRMAWRAEFAGLFFAMAAVALIRPVLLIGSFESRLASGSTSALDGECRVDELPTIPTSALPDIYFIVVDGYGRGDTLLKFFEFDNSDFLDFLKSRGFYVADRSRANYLQTRLSLAATLNMTYLDSEVYGEEPELTLAKAIRRSAVRQRFESIGYRTVAFNTGYRTTEMSDADSYLAPGSIAGSMIGLEPVLLETSMVGWLGDTSRFMNHPFFMQDQAAHRRRVGFALDQLENAVPLLPGPKFVFAHIISPHPPFVFSRDGSLPDQHLPFSPDDGGDFPGTLTDYVRGYTEQLIYLNQRLIGVVDGIVSHSRIPPIIILQADHGPGSRLVWSSPETSDLRERASILSAYLLPQGGGELLRPSISPVNGFRAVLATQVGVACPQLRDESYFSDWSNPTEFTPIPAEPEPAGT